MRQRQFVVIAFILAISVMAYGQINIEELRRVAEEGNADAQNTLGIVYKKGQGVEPDFKQAAFWFRKAAKQGNAAAETNLGLLYEFGDGVEQDLNQALSWFQKAADQGNTDARNGLVAVTILLSDKAEEQKSQKLVKQLPAQTDPSLRTESASQTEPALEGFFLASSPRQMSSAIASKGLPTASCKDVGSGFKDCITQRGKPGDKNFSGLQLNFFHDSLYQVSYLFPSDTLPEVLRELSDTYGEPESMPRGGKRWKLGANDRQLVLMSKGDDGNVSMAVLFYVKLLAKRDADDAANLRGRYAGH